MRCNSPNTVPRGAALRTGKTPEALWAYHNPSSPGLKTNHLPRELCIGRNDPDLSPPLPGLKASEHSGDEKEGIVWDTERKVGSDATRGFAAAGAASTWRGTERTTASGDEGDSATSTLAEAASSWSREEDNWH